MLPEATQSFGINVFQQVLDSRGMVLMVLIVLIAMSVACWFIIAYKWLSFRKLRRQSEAFVGTFWRSETLDGVWDASEQTGDAPVARVFRAAYTELGRIKAGNAQGIAGGEDYGFQNIERTLRRAQQVEQTRLERMVPFLATTGSAAPFIGLFGTVWGIMDTFIGIGVTGSTSLVSVAPGIAEALIATAVGLFAAIPAVMAYNMFLHQLKDQITDMEDFSLELLSIAERLYGSP